jgi:hypothetical protein
MSDTEEAVAEKSETAKNDLPPLPEGLAEEDYVKPVALAKELDIRPQIVYGWIRNGSLPAYSKGGEGRFIVRSEFAEWQEAKEQRKAERETKKAEKAQKDAEKAAAGENVDADEDDDETEDYE